MADCGSVSKTPLRMTPKRKQTFQIELIKKRLLADNPPTAMAKTLVLAVSNETEHQTD
jgi:hypothetical protein